MAWVVVVYCLNDGVGIAKDRKRAAGYVDLGVTRSQHYGGDNNRRLSKPDQVAHIEVPRVPKARRESLKPRPRPTWEDCSHPTSKKATAALPRRT